MTITNQKKTTKPSFEISNIFLKILKFRRLLSKRYLCIDIGSNYIAFAEVNYYNGSINFDKIRKVELPDEALDKGIPLDPKLMSELIKSIIKEEKIFALRTAISLSPDSVYTKLIEIPSKYNEEEALDYILDPYSPLQIPISLKQTDFDISKTSNTTKTSSQGELDQYLLVSIPKKSTEALIKTFNLAGQQLNTINIGFSCQAKLLESEISKLKDKEYIVILELLSECTHFTILDSSGPINLNRLSSIRDYPFKNNNQYVESNDSSNNKSKNVKKENYLPISNLDVKILSQEVIRSIQSFLCLYVDNFKCSVYLTGINSAHPNLTKVLGMSLGLETSLIDGLNSYGIGEVNYDPETIIDRSLGRLLGLALGLLNSNDHNKYSSLSNSFITETYTPKNIRKFKSLSIKESTYNSMLNRQKKITINHRDTNIKNNNEENNNFSQVKSSSQENKNYLLIEKDNKFSNIEKNKLDNQVQQSKAKNKLNDSPNSSLNTLSKSSEMKLSDNSVHESKTKNNLNNSLNSSLNSSSNSSKDKEPEDDFKLDTNFLDK